MCPKYSLLARKKGITELISNCETFQNAQPAKLFQPLLKQEIPESVVKIGTDLFLFTQ